MDRLPLIASRLRSTIFNTMQNQPHKEKKRHKIDITFNIPKPQIRTNVGVTLTKCPTKTLYDV